MKRETEAKTIDRMRIEGKQPCLVIVPPGCLTASVKRKIEKAGYLVVVTNSPDKIRVMSMPAPLPKIKVDGIASIALDIIKDEQIHSHYIRERFRERVVAAAYAAGQ